MSRNIIVINQKSHAIITTNLELEMYFQHCQHCCYNPPPIYG